MLFAAFFQAVISVAATPADATGTPERWYLNPTTRYEAPEGLLSSVGTIVVGDEGRICVSDRLRKEILVFDARGQREAIGSEGEGPGEFRAIWNLGLLGDTLWVADSRLGRLSFFEPGGDLLATRDVLRYLALPPGMRSPLLQGAVAFDAAFVIALREDPKAEEAVFLRVSEEDERVIGSLALGSRWYAINLPGKGPSRSSDHQPFGFYDQFALSPYGSRFVIVRRQGSRRLQAEYAVELYDGHGKPQLSITVPYERRRLTSAEVEAWLDAYTERGVVQAWLRSGLFTGPRAFRETAKQALTIPETAPPTANSGSGIRDSGILFGRSGDLFIRRFETRDSQGQRWDVIDPGRGDRIAVLAVPEGVTLLAVDGRKAWGVTHDAYDVPTIREYTMEVGGSP